MDTKPPREGAIKNITQLQRLREAGLRPTMARIAILQVFEEAAGEPLSIDQVFKRTVQRGLRMSLGTVYRVANQLTHSGMLRSLRTQGHKQMFRANAAALSAPDAAETAMAPMWAVNLSSGACVRLSDLSLWQSILDAALAAGLDMAGGHFALELDTIDRRPQLARHADRAQRALPAPNVGDASRM